MPRAMQSAALSFGLVNIPVKLYPAVSSKSVSFHMLHAKDGSRIKQHLFCQAENKEIPRDEVVKGYEVTKGQYVEITEEELEKLEEAANQAVEILEFVPPEAVDPVFYEKTYFLGPDKGGEKAYRLLVDAMRERKRVAVAKFVMRGKENLVVIRPVDGHLMLHVMFYADEVRNIKDIEVPEHKVKGGELALAEQLIESLSEDKWEPDKYQDTYRERVLEMIRKKMEGKEITAPPGAPSAEVVDLVSALKSSLKKGPRRETGRQRKAYASHH